MPEKQKMWRCADAGCPTCRDCARFIDIDRESTADPVMASLFPYDIPLGSACPHFEARVS